MFDKNLRGSFTIEASLIFPIILFVVVTLIYMVFYLHDKTYLQSIANQAAERGASILSYERREINTNHIDYGSINNRSLYWRWGSDFNREEESIREFILEHMENGFLHASHQNVVIVTKVEQSWLNNYVTVTIEVPYPTPFYFITQMLNKGQPLKIRVQSKGKLLDASEFVRNVQLIDQLSEDITLLKEPKNQFEELVTRIKKNFEE